MAINSSPSPSRPWPPEPVRPCGRVRGAPALAPDLGFPGLALQRPETSLESFQAHRDELEAFIMEQPWVSWLAFLGVYT